MGYLNNSDAKLYDHLTQLPSYGFFREIVAKIIHYSMRRNSIFSILIIELDNFDAINKQFGNTVGDQIVKEMSQRFASVIRKEDIISRLEDNKFIILLPDINKPKFASGVAKKLFDMCSRSMMIGTQVVFFRANIGICIYPNDGISLEELLNHVNVALEKARNEKNIDYQFYTEAMNNEANEFMLISHALQKAIPNNELVIYYQPKLNMQKGKMVGLEALIRWTHPQLGILEAGTFLPIAEETGLSMKIAEWVLTEACKTNKFWQNEGYEHLTLSVNLSPKQFYDPNITILITNALQKADLNPAYLEIEINENTVMHDMLKASQILHEIKKTGVQISLDHFGTGYTSISHLKEFPINTLKIDRSFIRGIPNIPNDIAITNAFIALAHHLGFDIVADGVETDSQVQYLASQGCDVIQGHFLSHPLPAQKIIKQFEKLINNIL